MTNKIGKAELKKLVEIAQRTIPALNGRGDLERRYSDDEDFFETAVWCIKDALLQAYELGKKAGREEN